MADAGESMTPYPQPVELDAVLDTSWEPVAEVVMNKVGPIHTTGESLWEQPSYDFKLFSSHGKRLW